ncbi:hypothetical protein I7I50_06973 [Histoplasma capsulatum G186AR]|uniref:Uncharacterized protein n=1 Tax=Ajellomyces capsulatus TaxID=5037 RepID=A0A8H7YYL5_AJECA|nr:hypothetical protein I7I52_09953 [Histoplasma capsulatum]QSS67788.1 hypothetical protein I7I50_06973 [Histoplasma capsulatum G186AR]
MFLNPYASAAARVAKPYSARACMGVWDWMDCAVEMGEPRMQDICSVRSTSVLPLPFVRSIYGILIPSSLSPLRSSLTRRDSGVILSSWRRTPLMSNATTIFFWLL